MFYVTRKGLKNKKHTKNTYWHTLLPENHKLHFSHTRKWFFFFSTANLTETPPINTRLCEKPRTMFNSDHYSPWWAICFSSFEILPYFLCESWLGRWDENYCVFGRFSSFYANTSSFLVCALQINRRRLGHRCVGFSQKIRLKEKHKFCPRLSGVF